MDKLFLYIIMIFAVALSIIGLFVISIYIWGIHHYKAVLSEAFLIYFERFGDIIPTLNIVVLSITFGVIAYYAIETQKLRKLTSEQLSYNTRPVVVLKIKRSSDSNHRTIPYMIRGKIHFNIENIRAELKNVGEGIATKIEMQPIEIADNKGNWIKIHTGEIMPLAKMDKEEAVFYVPQADIGRSSIREKLIDGKTKDNIIKLHYNDLQGSKFYTLMKLKEAGGEWSFFDTGKA